MSYKNVTNEDLLRTLREVAAEQPEKVYKSPAGAGGSCFYVHGNEPGCIVGHALHRLGVPLETLKEHESDAARAPLNDLFPEVTEGAMDLVDSVQYLQDRGEPWGEAIKALDE